MSVKLEVVLLMICTAALSLGVVNDRSQEKRLKEEIAKLEAETNALKGVITTYQHEINQLNQYINELKETEGTYFTASEIDLLERLVEAEAGGEPYQGRVAVAQVVLNRVKSEKFPDSIKEVIYQPYQFEPVQIGTIDTKTASETTKEAVRAALNGEKVVGDDILYFWARYVPRSHDIWSSCPVISTIGVHHFSNVWE